MKTVAVLCLLALVPSLAVALAPMEYVKVTVVCDEVLELWTVYEIPTSQGPAVWEQAILDAVDAEDVSCEADALDDIETLLNGGEVLGGGVECGNTKKGPDGSIYDCWGSCSDCYWIEVTGSS